MITKMKKYTFLVFHREYDAFLEKLRNVGVLHVAQKAEGIAEDEQLNEQLVLSQKLQKTIAEAENILPEQTQPVQTGQINTDINVLMQDFADLQSQTQQLQADIAALKKEQKRMAVWGDFSEDKLNALKQQGYNLQFFTCPEKSFNPDWENLYHAFIVAQQGGVVWFVTINHDNEAFELGAEQVELNSRNSTQLQADIDALNTKLSEAEQQQQLWAVAHLGELHTALQQTQLDIDWSKVQLSTTALADEHLCLLEGFCPVDNIEELNSMLDNEHIYYTAEEPTEEDPTPIKLHNNWFTSLFECLTGMYGWPVYGEFDPTPILAPFFLLFFAMCMGDAGYGILLILFGILTTKNKIKISMFEGLGPLITVLGVGTLVVGFFLGTFFGIDLYSASWVPQSLKGLMIKGEVMGYDIQMVLAICIGIFHICLAMVVKAICYTKRFGFKKNISTWGWLLLILGALIVGVLFSTEVFSVQVTKWVLIVIGSISALAIYIFNTPGRNPLINIGAGLWDTYNMATGILGDVLSYIRLYALGLAGGMLGAAFNSLGLMVLGENPGVLSWAGFIVILLIGHLLNLLMSALGAFVHPLRLSFVEYFKNSGYEGKGSLYQPFQS